MTSNFPPKLYGCLHIDLPWIDMLYALSYVASPKKYTQVQNELEGMLGGSERVLVSLSVRSAFDLFLQASDFPPGSELITTNINTQNMKDIAKYHGLTLIGIDIDISDLKPKLSDIEDAITSRTVGIMVVQLFGRKYKTCEIRKIARKYDLVLIEDCSQGYSGPSCIEDVDTDITFFSFGSIKRFTCLGGAFTVSENSALLQKMRKIQMSYAYQGRLTYMRKLLKYVLLMLILNMPHILWLAASLLSALGMDYKMYFKSKLRGFYGELMQLIRFQPSLPLLLLLKRRTTQLYTDMGCNERAVNNAEFAIACLHCKPVYVIGCLAEIRDYWMFPVLVDNPNEVEKELEEQGVSAFVKASTLVLMDSEEKDKLKSSCFLLKHRLFLPIDKRSDRNHIDKVIRGVTLVIERRKSIFDIADEAGVVLAQDWKKLQDLGFNAAGQAN